MEILVENTPVCEPLAKPIVVIISFLDMLLRSRPVCRNKRRLASWWQKEKGYWLRVYCNILRIRYYAAEVGRCTDARAE